MKYITERRHKKYHGSVAGSGELDIPLVPRRQQVASNTSKILPGVLPSHLEEPLDPAVLEAEETRCHYCQLAKFIMSDLYPVTITNRIDKSTIPANFAFIEESTFREGVVAADEDFRSGCECTSDVQCESDCSCLEDMGGHISGSAYMSKGNRSGFLKDEILESREAIYECHDACACSQACENRVVEQGRKIALDIFKTTNRGWGVRTRADIRKGQFVDKYIGEVITPAEAQRRREASNIAQRKDVYLFALDKFHDIDSPDPRLAAVPYEIDGEFTSGPTRFINHSCSPNLRIFARVGDWADKPLHELAFFAVKDIPAGRELTFDYVDGIDEDEGEAINPKLTDDMTECVCGSSNCRGFLW